MKIKTIVTEHVEGHDMVKLLQESFSRTLMKHIKQFIRIERSKPGVKSMTAVLLTEEDAKMILRMIDKSSLTDDQRQVVNNVLKPYKPATITLDEMREMKVPQLKQLILNCGGTQADLNDVFRGDVETLAKKTNTPLHPDGLQETWLWCIKAILRRSNDH